MARAKATRFTTRSHFTVFDCFDGTLLAYFKNGDGDHQRNRLISRRARSHEVIDDIWSNRDRDYNIRLPGEAPAPHRQGRCPAKRASPSQLDSRWRRGRVRSNVASGRLRLHLIKRWHCASMTHVPEACSSTTRARPGQLHQGIGRTRTRSTSGRVVRDSGGNDDRPEDYLTAFATFVPGETARAHRGAFACRLIDHETGGRRHIDRVARESSPASQSLHDGQPAKSTRRRTTGKALVDIISMVKHAAKSE